MDWLSWLSRTCLEPSLVYEYGLALTHNELEEEDIRYFNHEFLQSMGISIAKHRLEILKLARKHRKRPGAMSRLLAATKSMRRSLSRYIHTWTCREEPSSALVVVPSRDGYSYSSRWRGAMVKRNKKQPVKMENHQARLLLTNGDGFSSPMVYHLRKDREKLHHVDDDDHEDGSWYNVVEEIKWDTMFQDLKPT